MSSPFLAIDPGEWVVATWFDASRDEQHAIFDLDDEVKRQLGWISFRATALSDHRGPPYF